MGHESRYFDASAKAKQFVKDHITIDSLIAPVSVGWPREEMFEEYHDRACDAGITCIGMTAAYGPLTFEDFLKQSQQFLQHIYASKGKYRMIRSSGDIKQAQDDGAHALFFNAQGCELLNNKPAYYAPLVKNAGVGTIALAYNERYRAGDGCLVDNADKVTMYGTQVIDALHANGILLDLSHASEATALSAIEYSHENYPEIPVIYTHSTPQAICDIYRSISDEEVIACAKTGGVIGIVTLPWFIIDPKAKETTPSDIVKAIDYVRDLVGIDHIGLSSDDTYSWPSLWEWAATVPEMYQDDGETAYAAKMKPSGTAEAAKMYPALVDALWGAGYSDEDIAKVLGGNLMRVYKQVWG
jgi:membrane dipeptidase